jgi:hypothetical protein
MPILFFLQLFTLTLRNPRGDSFHNFELRYRNPSGDSYQNLGLCGHIRFSNHKTHVMTCRHICIVSILGQHVSHWVLATREVVAPLPSFWTQPQRCHI